MTTIPLIDEAAFEALKADLGDDVMDMLLDAFRQDSAQRRAHLVEAIAAEDIDTMEKAAHSLKGAAGGICLVRVTQVSVDLVTAARAGDLPRSLELAPKVIAAIDDTLAAIG